MFDPYGPLPSAVYWRRRVVALILLALLLAAGAWGLSTLFGGGSPPRPASQPPSGPGPSSNPTTTDTAAQARPPTAPTCPDSAIRVSAEVTGKEHRAGDPVVFRLVVTNTGDRACRRDTGALVRELVVSTPDGRRVWSSNDCHAHTTNEMPLLQPGKSVHNKITWLGRTSVPGCPLRREAVAAGEYRVVAKLGELASEPVPFRLAAPAPVTSEGR